MGIQHKDLSKKSAAVILEFQQPSGAYPASPTFPVYQYTWFRDGSFSADAMSRAGEIASAERFFDWCATVILGQRDTIERGKTLDTRYTYDGVRPEGEWASFQLDGYGILLWAMKQHELRHGRSMEQYTELIELVQRYLVAHWQAPCYDWWEERVGHHAASLACVYAGLHAYKNPVAYHVKNAIDLSKERTDASTLVCLFFDAVTADEFASLLKNIETELISESGGVYRYAEDTYYGGGEWPVLTALLGLCYQKLGRTDDAQRKLAWCAEQMQDNGWIPEQDSTRALHPERMQPWVDKWGQAANPLLWSQAMVVTLATKT